MLTVSLTLISFNLAFNFSIKVGDMASSQSSDVYDLTNFIICALVSDGQISQILSTSASDFLDCSSNAASVKGDEGVIIESDF